MGDVSHPGPPVSFKDYIIPFVCALSLVVGYSVWFLGSKYLKSLVTIAVLLNLQIVFTYILDILFVSKNFVWTNILGAVFVVGSCLVITKEKAEKIESLKNDMMVKPLIEEEEKVSTKDSNGIELENVNVKEEMS